MKRKNWLNRLLAGALAVSVTISGMWLPETVEAATGTTSTLTVDMTAETGDILHGASGFLYGISNEDVPTTNTLVPLKPKVLATKGALGTEHPYGDALDVAETFLSSGGEQVMMYNSNYYGVFGVTANYRDYSNVLKNTIAPYVYNWKQDWKKEHGTPENPKDELGKIDIDAAIIYIPINEGTPVNGASNTNIAWKAYYDAIKAGDPDATIAGPNSASYGSQFVNTNFRSHMQYCADNNCMPDIITWHELQTNTLQSMSQHMDDFRNIWNGINWTKWLQTHDEIIEMPQIVINEYAEMKDCGVPGALVNWIARLEDEKIYGCLPFWQQANNLNGLTSDANEGAGAWWVYKWYGDMSGQTLKVETSTSYDRLYGVAAIDESKQSASVLMGGEDGNQKLLLENIDDTTIFKDEEIVHVSVQKAAYNGYAGTVSEVPTILEGNFPVSDNGSVEITIPDTKFADAFYVTVTKTNAAEVNDPLVSRYSVTYEAEAAQFEDLYVQQIASYNPTYYFSDGYVVLMDEEDCELTYEIEVPADGKYQLNFLYGNGTGSSRNDMYNHKPLNVKQSYQIDGGKAETVIMENTLFTAITDCHTKYVDLKAGKHTITITSLEDADVIHDALTVTYAGAYNVAKPAWSDVYEAEQADFNTLADCEKSQVLTKTDISGYSGNGYVTGLNAVSVVNGGGIRWNVVVEESGIYNFTLRYQASQAGKANIYIGNTTTTLDSLSKTVDISGSNNAWKTVAASIYLQKGINIVDVDASVDAALDYMKVQKVPESSLSEGKSVVIEAEDCIPAGSAIAAANSEGASGGKYVVGYEGNQNAESDVNKYLEFTYDAPQAGTYELQIFQSNDDICGSHSYNIKIIDKYASVQVKGANGVVTEENRYFFINTSSNDTFKEKTVQVQLEKGKNILKIFNDDSWHVTWGGTTATPGLNELDNYTPNFDKFVLTPMALDAAAQVEETCQIQIQTTAGGYAAADKNEVASGENSVISIYPKKGVDKVYVNGTNVSKNVKEENGEYTLAISNITEDQLVEIYFLEGSGEYIDPYITNASFATKDLTGWKASANSTKVNNASVDSYEGYHAEISEGTLKQTVTGIPAGYYNLYVYSKAKAGANISGQTVLKAHNQTLPLMAGTTYEENILRVSVGADGVLDIEVDASALNGTICLDYFVLEVVPERDMSQVDELTAYFVDCGDHDPTTLSAGDLYGLNNSVTDQVYSADRSTGYFWGVVTSEEDYAMSRGEKGVYTNYQWANEHDTSDGLAKTATFRYAHGQDTAGINPRYVKYRFELDSKEYNVSVCMSNTWNNAGRPKIYLNNTQISAGNFTVAANSNAVASGRIDLSQAEVNENGRVVLDVYALSTDATIQMNYITIAEYREFADMSKLQASYDAVKDTVYDGYMANSWADFQEALKAAEAFLNTENVPYTRQQEVNAARAALDIAFASLVRISDVQDPELLYFVDCGDHNPSTLTGKDKFGIYNSVTDQIYSPDAVSGKSWGVVTSAADVKISAERAADKGVYTTFQRANQNSDAETADGQNKKTTYRYAHNQLESGINPRYVKYQFELEPETYLVEVCMGNNWGNSANPDVYLNDLKINEDALGVAQGGNKVVTGEITITQGESLMVAAYSQDATINMNYIKIYKPEEKPIPVKLPFEDVAENDWFYTAVYNNYLANLMTGVNATTFAPFINLTRAQMAQILYNMENKPAVKYTDRFPDVADGEWFTDAVLWAAANDIATGYAHSGEFDPHGNITREQAATMMLRYAKFKDYDVDTAGDLSKFADTASVSEFAKEAMQWAVGNGIISGKENGSKLDPQGQALRAECAVIINNFMDDSIHAYSESQISAYYINPFYEDAIHIEDIKKDVFQNGSSTYAAPRYEKDLNVLVASLRNNMVNRMENITLYFQSSVELDNTFLHNWIDLAVAETGNSKEGDYLKWHFGGASAEAYCKYYPSLKTYYYDVNIVLSYYTTYEQEEEFDKTIALVLNELNLKNETSDFIKAKAIYDYVCENVAYDYENLKDDTYRLKYSAYAALLNKTAVCQGYATLLYRLLEDSGIDNRVVVGTSDGENHAWNLIKISDKYYFADSTWDAGEENYRYFLKGSSDFKYHDPEVDFLGLYPISDISYDMGFTDVNKLDWFYTAVYNNYFNQLMTGINATTFAPFLNLTRAQMVQILYNMESKPDVQYADKFPDVADGEWFTNAVLWAAANDIATGYAHSGEFDPHGNITREQAATMMLRYAKFKDYKADTTGEISKFADAEAVSEYAKDAMQWAVGNNIITGKENGTKLDPQGQALRAECAVIINNFIKVYK